MRGAAVAAALLATAAVAGDKVWRWVDAQGGEHYTNDPRSIPEKLKEPARQVKGQPLDQLSPGGGALTDTEPAAAEPTAAEPTAAEEPPALRAVLYQGATPTDEKLKKSGAVEKLLERHQELAFERVDCREQAARCAKANAGSPPVLVFVDEFEREHGRVAGAPSLALYEKALERAKAPRPEAP